MTALVAALLALAVGPLLVAAGRRVHGALLFVDGFVLAAVLGLVVVDVLPSAVVVAGPLALVAAAAGLLVPLVLHDALGAKGRNVAPAMFAAALFGLLAHAIVDGVSLRAAEQTASPALAWSVVLHGVPVGAAAWWIARPLYGLVGAVVLLAVQGVGAVLGYALAGDVLPATSSPLLWTLQAVAAGAVLHVVFGHGPPRRDGAPSSIARLLGVVGVIAGVLVVVATHADHGGAHAIGHVHAEGHGHGLGGDALLDIVRWWAPFLVLAIAASTWSARRRGRAAPGVKPTGGRASLAVRGATRGAVVASTEELAPGGLLTRTAPPAAQAAFLVAASALGLATLLVGLGALPLVVGAARAVAVIVAAVIAGVVVGGGAPLVVAPARRPRSFALSPTSMRSAPRAAFADDLAASTAALVPPAALGVVLAATLVYALPPASTTVQVAVATAVGLLVPIGGLAATVVVGAMPVAPAAAVAFLVVAPTLGPRRVRGVARRHGAVRAALYVIVVGGVAFAAAFAVDAVDAPQWRMHPLPLLVGDVALGLVAAGALLVLYRDGARLFAARAVFFSTLRIDDHHRAPGDDPLHLHGPGCGHEAVPHEDHVDYLVEGHLHHPHEDHCDDHGQR